MLKPYSTKASRSDRGPASSELGHQPRVSVIPSARSERHMLENLKLASIAGFVRLRTILKSFTFVLLENLET